MPCEPIYLPPSIFTNLTTTLRHLTPHPRPRHSSPTPKLLPAPPPLKSCLKPRSPPPPPSPTSSSPTAPRPHRTVTFLDPPSQIHPTQYWIPTTWDLAELKRDLRRARRDQMKGVLEDNPDKEPKEIPRENRPSGETCQRWRILRGLRGVRGQGRQRCPKVRRWEGGKGVMGKGRGGGAGGEGEGGERDGDGEGGVKGQIQERRWFLFDEEGVCRVVETRDGDGVRAWTQDGRRAVFRWADSESERGVEGNAGGDKKRGEKGEEKGEDTRTHTVHEINL